MSIDLTTTYLKLELKNPLVVAASPMSGNLDSLAAVEEAGAGAVVLPSLFAEQIEHDELEIFRLHEFTGEYGAESQSFFPEPEHYNSGPAPYLEFIEKAKQRLSVPVIASLNGTTPGKWVKYGKQMEMAGADALELNIYYVPTDVSIGAEAIESQYIEIVASVAQELSIPLAVKIGPYFSSLPQFTKRLVEAGADGLVLFNRYLDPELDLETLQVRPNLVLSNPHELRLVVRWLGILRDQLTCSLAATSGIHSTTDVIKSLLAGADVTMMASALLMQGPEHIGTILSELAKWLEERDYPSVRQLIGSVSYQRCGDPSAFERGNYMKALVSYSNKSN